MTAMRKANIEPSPGPRLEGWVKDAGFTDVHHEKCILPVGTWPSDKHLVSDVLFFVQTNPHSPFPHPANLHFPSPQQKEIGAWNYLQIMEGLEASKLALFTRKLGYTKAEVDVVCSAIRKEMRNPKLHMMFHL